MKPKKTLGQHFLTSQKAILDIVKAGELLKNDLVLEIGPGQGVLTEKLLESGVKVLAIEKDGDLVEFLKEKFLKEIKAGDLKILHQDILKTSIPEIFDPKQELKYKLIANIPYNITGSILQKFLSEKIKPDLMVLLIQKEVAERIIAKNGKESILSLAVKFYCDDNNPPKIISKVSAGSFFPKPKVDSAIIKIRLSQGLKHNKDKKQEELYFEIVKKAFAHKRKMMLGNLKALKGEIVWDKIFTESKIDKKIRAEDLKKKDFLKIVESVMKK